MSASARHGFTLIELIIVIAILSVLVGTAVPYYQESIVDARRSQLKQNLANYRKVLNDFRGDQRRGAFRVQVRKGATTMLDNPLGNLGSGSELVCGPVQIVNGSVVRRTNIRYLPALPTLNDPATGEQINQGSSGNAYWNYAPGYCKFCDTGDGIFDISTEGAFEDVDNDNKYNQASGDVILFNSVPGAGVATLALDYTDVTVMTQEGPF